MNRFYNINIVKKSSKHLLMKYKWMLLFIIVFSPPNHTFSQQYIPTDTIKNQIRIDGHLVQGLVENGDTLLHVPLRAITILPPYKFKSKRHRRRYTRLVRYVKKVYPYSQIVSKQLNEINRDLEKYKTKREKELYIKLKEKQLKKQFEGKLRKLTYTQGRILIKLIDRETGYTTYELVKQLKGSLNAFFWQSIARLFGSNLKMEYDAKGDDRMIEDIVVRIENGQL